MLFKRIILYNNTFLLKIVTFASDDIAEKAILLLKEIYIHLGPNLKNEQVCFISMKFVFMS